MAILMVHLKEALLGSCLLRLLPFPFLLLAYRSLSQLGQACVYKDSELRFEERLFGIASGLQKPRGSFQGGPR